MTKLNKFGTFIRELRTKKDIGQRELAKKINISASYLNDIEKNKRSAPKIDILKKLSKTLDIDFKYLNDLVGITNKDIAPDIYEYIKEKPEIISFLRLLKENNFTKSDLSELENNILKHKTKALIVAAGLGSRLKKHTEELPKCMLDFGGKTLLQRQLEAYEEAGIRDIYLIKGYKKNKINYKGIKYFTNNGMDKYISFIHFGLTSQDITNTAYNLMIHDYIRNSFIQLLEDTTNVLYNFILFYYYINYR